MAKWVMTCCEAWCLEYIPGSHWWIVFWPPQLVCTHTPSLTKGVCGGGDEVRHMVPCSGFCRYAHGHKNTDPNSLILIKICSFFSLWMCIGLTWHCCIHCNEEHWNTKFLPQSARQESLDSQQNTLSICLFALLLTTYCLITIIWD